MKIFIDLDECLIHASLNRGGGPKKGKVLLRFPEDSYWTQERPLAKEMLSDCRGIGETVMLTTAIREYALKVNETFTLGFTEETIIAQEDYLKEEVIEGKPDWSLVKTNFCPDSILIDNNPKNNVWAKAKMRFLGIGEENYFQVREFTGQEPKRFAQEWKDLVCAIKGRKSMPVAPRKSSFLNLESRVWGI